MIPTFETQRLILKPITMHDIPAYKKYFVDYEVIRYLSSQVPWPYPENGVEDYLQNIIIPNQENDSWAFGIFLKTKPQELIGGISLFRKLKNPQAPENRGFWLGRKFWGQGLMTEAVFPINHYAFDGLGFDQLFFANALGNQRSRRIKEKTGAKYLETRPTQHVDPELTHSELWELTRENWKKFSRPNFIANYREHQEADNAHYPNSDELLSIGSPLGKILGLKNIGIHIETLLPGRRTSWPHAESLEEEFAFVLEGYPEVWINGILHPLKEGDFVAFPSGTGIAHTFINNTDQNVLLLVGGETAKADNKIFYPLHPTRNLEMKEKNILWENCPTQESGAHNGQPNEQKI